MWPCPQALAWDADGVASHTPGPSGLVQLLHHLSRDLDVRYSTVVEHIGCVDSVVTVKHSQGEAAAKAVLVTVPLGVLQNRSIGFSPALPGWKWDAIDAVGMGLINKVCPAPHASRRA